tara:strand:- start:1097 stop:1570 length:474 start_codon:yes stop_codon:yes gene_type:complete
MVFLNKIVVYCPKSSSLAENFFIKNNLKYRFEDGVIDKANSLSLPLFYYYSDFEVIIFTDKERYFEYYSLINKTYPHSLFLFYLSKKDPIYFNKSILYFFNTKPKKVIDSFLVRLPAEKYNIQNKFKIKDFNSNNLKFFNQESELKENLNLISSVYF